MYAAEIKTIIDY